MSRKSKTSTELTRHRCPLRNSWQQSLGTIVVVALSNTLASEKCVIYDSTCFDSRCSTWLGDMARIILAASSIGWIKNESSFWQGWSLLSSRRTVAKRKNIGFPNTATTHDLPLSSHTNPSRNGIYHLGLSGRAELCTLFRGEILNWYHTDWRWGFSERVRSRMLFSFYRSCDSPRA